MPAMIDLIGKVFGDLTVLSYAGRYHGGGSQWLCRCACGKEVIKTAGTLKNGTSSCSIQCGVSKSNANRSKHGDARGKRNTASRHTNTKEYNCWRQIKQRCLNPNAAKYKDYGGRGLKIAPQWFASYETFLKDVGRAPTAKHTLERIDNSKGYEPSNVRWATRLEQSRNRRTNVYFTYEGVNKTLKEWAAVFKVPYSAAHTRYKAGRTFDEIVGITPIKLGRPKGDKK
jgi:hypothetical protein